MENLLRPVLLCLVGAVLAQAATLNTKGCKNALSVGPLQLESDVRGAFTIANNNGQRAEEGKYQLNLPLATVFETVLGGEGDDTTITLPKQLAQEVYDALKENEQSAALFTLIASDMLTYGMSITLQPEEEAIVNLIVDADYAPGTETHRLENMDESSDCSEESKVIKKSLSSFVTPETLDFHNSDFLKDFEGFDKEEILIALSLQKTFPTHKTSVVSYKNNNTTRTALATLSERLVCDNECVYIWYIDLDFPPKKYLSTPVVVPEFRDTVIQKKLKGMNYTPFLENVAGVYQYQFSNPSDNYQEALFYVDGPGLLVNCTVELDEGRYPTYNMVTRKRGQIEYNNIKLASNQTVIYMAKLAPKDNVVRHQCAVFMEPRSSITINLKFFKKTTEGGEEHQVDLYHNSDILSLGYGSDPKSTTERLQCSDSEENDDSVVDFTFYPYSIHRSTRKLSLLITSEPFPEAKDQLLEKELIMSLFALEGLCP